MMKKTLLLLALSLTPSQLLAQNVEQIAAPSGALVNFVKCSQKSSKCMNRAGKHCGGSYQVIDSESHAGGLFADALPGPVTWYSMTFLCGPSNGAFPQFPFRGPEFKMPSVLIPPTIQTTCTQAGDFLNCTTY